MVISKTASIVYNDIKSDILYLNLMPGDIISENQLSEKYGISRTPIRDALKSLVTEGLLEVKPHAGTFVTLINLDTVSDSVFIRQSLELSVLKELCPNFTPFHAMELEQILSEQKKLVNHEDSDIARVTFIQADNDFHQKLFELAGKGRVWQHISSMNQHYLRFRYLLVRYNSDPINVLYDQHKHMLSLLSNKDWAQLKEYTANHITSGFQKCGNILTEYSNLFIKPSN